MDNRFTASDEMCNIYLMYYTNASSALPHIRQFLDCHGNNFPELVTKIPSTADLRMDQRQSHGANVEYHDVRGQETVEEGSAVDGNAPQYFRRRNGSRNNKYLTGYADAQNRYFADESTDAAGTYEFERQPQRNRNRPQFAGSSSDYPVDSKPDNYEQSGSVSDESSKQQNNEALRKKFAAAAAATKVPKDALIFVCLFFIYVFYVVINVAIYNV